ncbi:MAG: hypothetical protein ACFFCM_01190 [Promethearchaeota archaeon]
MKNNKDIQKVVKKLGYPNQIAETDLGEVVEFEVKVNDRLQNCIAKISTHAQHGEIVEVVSIIGDLGEVVKTNPNKAIETLMALLMLNQDLILAKTQIDRKGEMMYLVSRTLAPSCSDKELGAMVQEVAIFADVLEQQLLGIDEA